jgi:glycosyltransferase involved in cell wall biosynthesis
MKIVLYVNSFLPLLGGREFVVHYLADALSTLGHDVRVFGPAGFWKNRRERFVYPVHRWPTLRGLMSDQVSLAAITLDTALWGADIIHAHNTYPTGYRAARLKRLRNIPLVITPHGADIQTIPEIGYGLMLDPVVRKKILCAIDRAELITAISNRIKAVLVDAGATEGKIRLIPNGVDVGRFSRQISSDVRGRLGVEPDARLIITIGRYNPRKGQEFLIRAMPRILARQPLTRLVIVGDNTEALLPLIQELALAGKVVLTGGISPSMDILNRKDALRAGGSPDYLAELLCSGELYVSAGTDDNSEGLSLAVLESMAAGLPIVATNISGNRDVVMPEDNGCLVKPSDETALADAVLSILDRPDVQQHMRAGARRTAMQYEWINIARRYVDAYQEAIELARR